MRKGRGKHWDYSAAMAPRFVSNRGPIRVVSVTCRIVLGIDLTLNEEG